MVIYVKGFREISLMEKLGDRVGVAGPAQIKDWHEPINQHSVVWLISLVEYGDVKFYSVESNIVEI